MATLLKNRSGSSKGILLVALLFVSFYIIGNFFPDTWWSTHFLAFVPTGLKLTFIAIAVGILALSVWVPDKIQIPDPFRKISRKYQVPVILIITLLMGWLFYTFPIANDYYGDAYKHADILHKTLKEIPDEVKQELKHIGLSPWAGQETIFALINYMSYHLQRSFYDSFLWFDIFFGVLFVLSWLIFLHYYLKDPFWRWVMIIALLTAPIMACFYGHTEIYAPVFFFSSLWMMALLIYFRTKRSGWLWALLLLWPVCFKLHPIAVLFLPALLLVFGWHFFRHKQWAKKWLTWKGVGLGLLLPVHIAGAIVYFFVLEDHKDPRILTDGVMEYDRLFLPLLSPDPPLDRYNLLSFNHIFDYFSELFLWSPVAVFLLLVVILFYRKSVQWNRPLVIITGTTLILSMSLFFMVNPLLSMPMDWDLMALPAIPLFFFTILLIEQLQDRHFSAKAGVAGLAIAIITIPMFVVLSHAEMHSHRLESVGIRLFRSYYQRAHLNIEHAISTLDDEAIYVERKKKVLAKLKPYAVPGNDLEYCRQLCALGQYYLRLKKDYPKAKGYFEEAYLYDPNESWVNLLLMEWHFVNENFREAYQYSLKLIELKHPGKRKALAIAINCALEAGMYQEAFNHSSQYLAKYNDDEANFVREIYTRLQMGDRVEELKYLFMK